MAEAHTPDRSRRWKHLIAGVGTLLVIGLIAATRCTPDRPSNAIVVPADHR